MTEVVRLTTSFKELGLALSPNGCFLFLGERNGAKQVEVWSLTGAEPKHCWTDRSVVPDFEAFSADSRRLAYLRSDGTMVVRDLLTGPVGQWRSCLGCECIGRWHSTRTSNDWRSALSWQAARSSWFTRSPAVSDGPSAASERLSWPHLAPGRTATRRWLDDGRIHLWDVPQQKELATWEGHKVGGVSLRGFNRAGSLLLSTDWSGTLRVWDTESGSRCLPCRWSEPSSMPRESGRHAYPLSRRWKAAARLLRLADGREHRRLVNRTAKGASVYYPSRVLTGTAAYWPSRESRKPAIGGTPALVDPTSGQKLATIPAVSGAHLLPLGYEPSGALLTYAGGYGLLRWPVHSESGLVRRFGPPQRLLELRVSDTWGIQR